MMVIILMTNAMEKENVLIKMVVIILVNLKIIQEMVREYNILQKEILYLKVSGLMI